MLNNTRTDDIPIPPQILKRFIRKEIAEAERSAMLRQRNFDQKKIEEAHEAGREEAKKATMEWAEKRWGKYGTMNIPNGTARNELMDFLQEK